jgi:hypothetical protein
VRIQYAIYTAFVVSVFSCVGDTPSSTELLQDSYVRYCQLEYNKNQKDNYKYKEYRKDKEYYLNNEVADSIVIDTLINQGLVKHYYQSIRREPVEVTPKPTNDGIYRPPFTHIYEYHAFTPDYMESHMTTADVLDLSIDHNSVAFLNVISDPTDDFKVIIYDIENGRKLNERSSNFDGSYYLGIRIDTTALDRMRCVVKLGDNFTIKEFNYSDVRI